MFFRIIFFSFFLFCNSINSKAQINIIADINCSSDTSYFTLSNTSNIDSAVWIITFFGLNDTIHSINASRYFFAQADINVSVTYFSNNSSFTIDSLFYIPGFSLSYLYDYSGCYGPITYNVTTPNSTYLWSNGATNAIIQPTQNGEYWVNVTNQCGTATDTSTLDYTFAPFNPLPSIKKLCDGDIDTLYAGPTTNNYLWFDGSTNNYFVVTQPIGLTVFINNNCGSVFAYSNVYYTSYPTISFLSDTVICDGSSVKLKANAENGNIIWYDGTGDTMKTISAAGLYYVTASNMCDTISDSVVTDFQLPPDVDLGNDTTICGGQFINFDVYQYGSTYQWFDGSTNPYNTFYGTQEISVTVTNACGIDSDTMRNRTVNIYLFLPDDSLLCKDDILPLDVWIDSTTNYLWSNGETNHYIEVSKPGIYEVTVSNLCGTLSDDIIITNYDCANCIKMPTAFTPNNDGKNDEYHGRTDCNITQFHLMIFNRWGQLMFESFDILNGWNGLYQNTEQPIGAYSYVLDYEWWDGNSSNKVEKSGNITLIR
jgi:gliding motility-associated-like protein